MGAKDGIVSGVFQKQQGVQSGWSSMSETRMVGTTDRDQTRRGVKYKSYQSCSAFQSIGTLTGESEALESFEQKQDESYCMFKKNFPGCFVEEIIRGHGQKQEELFGRLANN